MTKKGKNFGGRRRKNYKKPSEANEKIIKEPEPPSKPFEKKKFKLGNAILILSAIVVIILGINPIRRMFLSEKKEWDEDNTISHHIESPKISENYTPIKVIPNFNFDPNSKYPKVKGIYIEGLRERKWLSIAIGNHIFECPIHQLYEGVEILNPILRDCGNSTLALAAKDDRLYVSAKFIPLSDEESTIGEMEFNHWKIYNGTFGDYDYKDDRFEVKDKHQNIVFSMAFTRGKEQSFVAIAGYFVSAKGIIVLNNKDVFTIHHEGDVRPKDCIPKSDPNWKQNAEIEIEKIKSTFK